MYKIELRKKVQKSLDVIPEDDFSAIIEAIWGLKDDPRPRGVEKLKGLGRIDVLWRIRQGDYRIVYSIDDSQKLVTIVRVGHRREVYR
ncbi:type II toxin-antitoxin system RelE/ParE family toxin [Chloroflexota bacterium]